MKSAESSERTPCLRNISEVLTAAPFLWHNWSLRNVILVPSCVLNKNYNTERGHRPSLNEGKREENKIFPVIILKNSSSHQSGSCLARFCAYTNRKDGTWLKRFTIQSNRKDMGTVEKNI